MSLSGEEIKELGDTTKKHLVSVLKMLLSLTHRLQQTFFFLGGGGAGGGENVIIISEHVSFVNQFYMNQHPLCFGKEKY